MVGKQAKGVTNALASWWLNVPVNGALCHANKAGNS